VFAPRYEHTLYGVLFTPISGFRRVEIRNCTVSRAHMTSLCTSCHRYEDRLWFDHSCRRHDAEKLYFVAAFNMQAAAAAPCTVHNCASFTGVSAGTLWATIPLPAWVLTPSTLQKKRR
jgi:hypothetical protein